MTHIPPFETACPGHVEYVDVVSLQSRAQLVCVVATDRTRQLSVSAWQRGEWRVTLLEEDAAQALLGVRAGRAALIFTTEGVYLWDTRRQELLRSVRMHGRPDQGSNELFPDFARWSPPAADRAIVVLPGRPLYAVAASDDELEILAQQRAGGSVRVVGTAYPPGHESRVTEHSAVVSRIFTRCGSEVFAAYTYRLTGPTDAGDGPTEHWYGEWSAGRGWSVRPLAAFSNGMYVTDIQCAAKEPWIIATTAAEGGGYVATRPSALDFQDLEGASQIPNAQFGMWGKRLCAVGVREGALVSRCFDVSR